MILPVMCSASTVTHTSDGIITQITATCPGVQGPKIQVWRESPNQYFKVVPDIPMDTTVCNKSMEILFNLLLADNESFEMHFKSGGPTNYA